MSFLRILVLSLAACFALEGCDGCTQPPAQELKKIEGEKCDADDDCESSICDAAPGDEKTCLRACTEGCDATFICTSFNSDARLAYACAPDRAGLCGECEADIDCAYPGDRCLSIGGQNVCGRDCSFDKVTCPASYKCSASVTASNGATVTYQCEPTSGTCACTSAADGQTRPCEQSNQYGTCSGVQTCRPPNGYDACSARVPKEELCNGIDDDCNGQTDENLGTTACGVGACRRTVSNCVNGTPQDCVAGLPEPELCDGIDSNCDGIVDTDIAQQEVCDGTDNDCDGLIDEDFNLTTDVNNCGSCGVVCNRPGGHIATYSCTPNAVVVGLCGIETCEPGYADCDGSYLNGCETYINGDINHCGQCDNACPTPASGTATCNMGQCNIDACNSPWADCNGLFADGCEVNTNTDKDHCGACDNACAAVPGATSHCNGSGSCTFTCLNGFYNANGDGSDGCEYFCPGNPSAYDEPQDNPLMPAADQNCDGIDGTIAIAIFVRPGGNDSNPGTMQEPKLTIQGAIEAAHFSVANPNVNPPVLKKIHVYAAIGTYVSTGTIALRSGVSVFGGFNPQTWRRDDVSGVTVIRAGTPTDGRAVALFGNNIDQALTLGYLNIEAPTQSGNGVATVAAQITNSGNQIVTLRGVTLTAGRGGDGLNGVGGSTGARPVGALRAI